MSIEQLFLEALKQGLEGAKVQQKQDLNAQELKALFQMAERHAVLPIIMEALYPNAFLKTRDVRTRKEIDKLVRSSVIRQAEKTAEFLLFYDYLASCGLHPVVMKGIICRNLYHQPEQRPSIDEDLLIEPGSFPVYHKAFVDYGLTPVNPKQDLKTADEVSYRSVENHLNIELHKTPFAKSSKEYGELNRFFKKVYERSITETVYGTVIHTLNHTDHLLYLILHVYKHFLYSGFGIRQVCDIVLYSEAFRGEILWGKIRMQLESCRAFDFARAIYKIADQRLLSYNHMKEYLYDWDICSIDEKPLLNDIMDSGLYGTATMVRLHSSTMTLRAKEESYRRPEKWMRRDKIYVINSVFLPLKKMEAKYSYLKRMPILLPLAWFHRVLRYLIEMKKEAEDNILFETVRLGQKRVRLLKMYHII